MAPATAGYQEGLEEAGWSGAAEIVELGMNATMGARYAWIGPALAETLGTEIGLVGGSRVIPGELTRAAQAGLADGRLAEGFQVLDTA